MEKGWTKSLVLNRFTIVVLLVCCSSVLALPARSDDVDGRIDEAFVRSGLSMQLDMLTGTIINAVPNDVFPQKGMRRLVGRYVKKTADKERLMATVRAAVELEFDREALQEVLKFYRSRLGRKVGKLQSRALTPSSISQIREGSKTVASMNEPRLEILKRIILAERVSEANFRLLDHMVDGLADGTLGKGDVEAEKIRQQLGALVDRTRSVHSSTERIALAAFANTYRPLNDKELKGLARFQESHAAGWFRTRVHRGLEEAVYIAAKALGEAIAELGKQTSDNTAVKQ